MTTSGSGRRMRALIVLAALLASPRGGSSFPLHQACPDTRRARLSNSEPRRRRVGPLHSTLDAPLRPMEDERGERTPDRRGWKRVAGGFVPKFLKRDSPPSDAAARPAARSSARPLVETVDTLEDYRRTVVEETERMVVVRFYAPWCKSCRAAHPLFKKMVSECAPAEVKFVEVPLTRDTAYIHEGLGVPSVPFGHIYHPDAGLVEERKINKKVFGAFRDALDSYLRGSCDLPPDEEEEEGGAEEESDLEFQ